MSPLLFKFSLLIKKQPLQNHYTEIFLLRQAAIGAPNRFSLFRAFIHTRIVYFSQQNHNANFCYPQHSTKKGSSLAEEPF
jgi:hypothetical protein